VRNVSKTRFDPRSKLAVILFASFTMMVSISWIDEFVFVTFLLLLFLVSGFWKKGLMFYGVFVLLTLADSFLFRQGNHLLIVLLDFFSVGYRRLLPTIMAAALPLVGRRTVSGWRRCKKCTCPMYY